METILDDVLNDRVFGVVKVWIHLPDVLETRFSEFPSIFKNAEITIADIGEHMQAFRRKNARRTDVKRSLITSMHGEGILLLTPLLKKYLESRSDTSGAFDFLQRKKPSLIGSHRKCATIVAVPTWVVPDMTHERRGFKVERELRLRADANEQVQTHPAVVCQREKSQQTPP